MIPDHFGFANVRNYAPGNYHGLVVLELPRDATSAFILGLIENFLKQTEIVARLAGRLAIVEAGRIRLRPA